MTATSAAAVYAPIEPPVGSDSLVYVIDDNSEIRRALHFSLATRGIVAWPFMSAQDFLDQVSSLAPAPILMDVRMPEMDGLDLLSALRDRQIDWPVIMMSAHGDIPVAVQSIRLGALDFLEKPFKLADLEELLARAQVALVTVRDRATNRDEARAAWKQLTKREGQVLEHLVTGSPNKTVATNLGISLRTVEIHRSRALSKLGVRTLAQVVSLQFRAE